MPQLQKYIPKHEDFHWKNILLIGVVATGGILAYKFLTKPSANDSANADAASVQNNVNNLPQQLPFYSNLADNIYDYMNGWILTDSGQNDNVITPLSQLNADEVKQVYKDFGARTFDFTVRPGDRSAHNMRSFAQIAMDSSGYDALNSILSNAGI